MVYPLHDKAPFKFSFPEKEVYHDSVEKAFHRRLSAARMSERTQKTYVFAVHQLGEHYNKSPDTITEEQLRDYFLHGKNVKKWSPSTRTIALSAIKFFYEETLKRNLSTPGIAETLVSCSIRPHRNRVNQVISHSIDFSDGAKDSRDTRQSDKTSHMWNTATSTQLARRWNPDHPGEQNRKDMEVLNFRGFEKSRSRSCLKSKGCSANSAIQGRYRQFLRWFPLSLARNRQKHGLDRIHDTCYPKRLK
jgi:hypothetical protein